MLKLSDVCAGYGKSEILHSMSLDVTEPAIYVVLGQNGAGKTTLFRAIAGVIKPTTGSVSLDDEDLYTEGRLRHEIGYLSHFSALPEEMTVGRALGFYAGIEQGQVERAAEIIGLRDLLLKKVVDLSQGQKKRASIAKLFLRERKLYLLDEPTSSLDPIVAKEVRDLLLDLSKDRFLLYSSHNLYEAQEIGDYIVLVKDGALSFFGKKEEIKSGGYKIGIRASVDVSSMVSGGKMERGYCVVKVSGPQEVGEIVKKLVQSNVMVYEVKEFGNPLEDLFMGARR